ncbi:MAG: alkaline phosphatase family protein [Candidatus Acidiferrum sp.]|jgi:predicted AlkP superfamily pyrophosphatase or phosphodiesterase
MRVRLSHKLLCLLLPICLACCFVQACTAQTNAPVIFVDHGPNAAQQIGKHYVVLVSLDGFRYDYPKLYDAKNILKLASEGASAPEGMIPSYPSVTFPNHYTIVTGLYPEHHGIVENTFYDPSRDQTYAINKPEAVTDGSWYGGTPLWVLAEQQGMRSACYFWPGSEAEIQGQRPAYYLHYDAKVPNDRRVEQVLDWLRLPPERRPHFITVYFSDVDHAGHEFGPGSSQVRDAVHGLDEIVGKLAAGIKALNLPIDLIVLADHGMAQYQGEKINLTQFDPEIRSQARIAGADVIYPKSEADAQKIYEALHGKSNKFEVYRRAQMPGYLHFDSNPRSGDPIIVAKGPYFLSFADLKEPASTPTGGNHGYDPAQVPEMKATFVAAGPDIQQNTKLAPFENVNVYPLIAHILGLDITHLQTGPIDGNLAVLQPMLAEQVPAHQ